jgi:hypothetical protein
MEPTLRAALSRASGFVQWDTASFRQLERVTAFHPVASFGCDAVRLMRKHELLAALTVLGAVLPGTARSEDPPIETQIVDALNKTFGVHAGYRANHAKAVVVEGTFKASPAAAMLSKAALFNDSAISAMVRFSNSTGIPNSPNGSDVANPHGMRALGVGIPPAVLVGAEVIE